MADATGPEAAPVAAAAARQQAPPQDRVAALERELEETKAEVKEAKHKAEAAEQEVQEAKQEVKRAEQAVAKLTASAAGTSADTEGLERLREDLRQLRRKEEQLREDLRQLREDLRQLRAKEERLGGELREERLQSQGRLTSNPTGESSGDIRRLLHEILSKMEKSNSIVQFLFRQKFKYTESVATRHSVNQQLLKQRLLSLSPASRASLARCMVLGVELSKSNVTGAHLFKFEWREFSSEIMGFEDIDDVRNGLLMYKPLEWAFDTSRMVILWDDAAKSFVTHILDKDILDVYLYKKAQELLGPKGSASSQSRPARSAYVPAACDTAAAQFRDIDKQPINLPSGHTPFRRCLMFHANLAILEAERRRWVTPGSFTIQNSWSDDSSRQKVSDWLLRLPEFSREDMAPTESSSVGPASTVTSQ